jgi:hypothetical protein
LRLVIAAGSICQGAAHADQHRYGVVVDPAGGGYGDPLARDPPRQGDVRTGLSAKRQRRYEAWFWARQCVEEPATCELRRQMHRTTWHGIDTAAVESSADAARAF